eukprot:scaffold1233_cov395-Prasinococcus_capsulatus_cf.AAC.1
MPGSVQQAWVSCGSAQGWDYCRGRGCPTKSQHCGSEFHRREPCPSPSSPTSTVVSAVGKPERGKGPVSSACEVARPRLHVCRERPRVPPP